MYFYFDLTVLRSSSWAYVLICTRFRRSRALTGHLPHARDIVANTTGLGMDKANNLSHMYAQCVAGSRLKFTGVVTVD